MSNIFNLSHDLENPRIYLCRKDFSRIGEITAFTADVTITMSLGNSDELSFTVYKSISGIDNPYWDDIVNLRLVYIYDYDEYFEIEVGEQESVIEIKQVTAQSLCESELSNLNISLEVNTDLDIDRADYSPTIIYNPDNPSASLLHRILKDKAPHYTISHIDSSLAPLQRTFSIDSNIDDFLRQELAPEIDAYVEYNTSKRSISLYDMLSVCKDCGYRGNFYDSCPMCNSTNVRNGYGEWTNVYISADNLAAEISLTAEKATIKNCFKVIGGDDNITNRIPSVNPNGTGYVVKFSDLQYSDMPTELTDKLKAYEALCRSKKDEYKNITLNICDCLDKILYYQFGMMPSPSASKTDASQEIKKITDDLSALMANPQAPNTIGLNTFSRFTTVSLVNSAILSYVKILLSPDYEASVVSSTYRFADTYGIWEGIIHVSSVSYPDKDSADSNKITLKVDGDGTAYVTQKISKALAAKDLKDQTYDYTLYSVDALQNFIDAYEACEGILVDHGDSGMSTDTPQYAIYNKYRTLKEAAIMEQASKQKTVDEWTRKKESYEAQQRAVNDLLNLQNYLGEDLFKLYCAYRRDDKYQNSNYISDGLSDSDLLKQAEKLLDSADKELDTACRNQYSLTATMNNLFLMDEFAPFHDKCRLGNWIYAEINDSVFMLRLIKIGINYESLDKVTVEFSNVREIYNSSTSIKNILNNAQSIAASYPATIKQVSEDSKTVSQINNWVDNGLSATNMMIANSPVQNTVFDENGILCRGYDEITGDFEPTQLRIVNSTLAVTDDNWTTTKAAIGKFIMQDPITGEYRYAMGIIGETIVGKLLLGENLGIYNNNQSMTFDKDGLKITNGKNTFTVNPDSKELLTISNSSQKVLYVDTDGMLHISGDGAGLDISTNESITMKVDASDFSAQKIVSMINIDESGVQISGEKIDITGNATFYNLKNGLSTGTTKINGDCITTGTISAEKIAADSLIVGKNVKMGENAVISWSQVTDKDGVVTEDDDISRLNNDAGYTTMNAVENKGYQNASQVTQITKDTVTTSYVNALKITAGSVAAENITGTTIEGKTLKGGNIVGGSIEGTAIHGGTINGMTINGTTIKGGNIEGTNLNGCAGGFTSIFLFNKEYVDSFQHGSICGQYLNDDGTVDQYEVIRVNNMCDRSDMYVYTPMYFYNSNAYPIFNPVKGLRFGSKVLGTDQCDYPIYMNMLYNEERPLSDRIGLRIGFKDGTDDVPAFEIYDDYDHEIGSGHTDHATSAKVFGNLEVSGIITDQSSIKYKTNIQPLSESDALNLLDYNIVSFDYKDGRKGRHGMIAEEAAEISEYAIVRDKNNEPDAIGYAGFIPDIIKLNQIMYKEIQDLKQQIRQLKGAE